MPKPRAMLRTSAAALLLALGFVSPGQAMTTEQLLQNARELTEKVPSGDPLASRKLANAIRLNALPSAFSYGDAIGLLHRASRAGDAPAIALLMWHYENGIRVPKDPEALGARSSFGTASCPDLDKASDPTDLYEGAWCQFKDPGREISRSALTALDKAAASGMAEALFLKAQAMSLGRGYATNINEAAKLYDAAFDAREPNTVKTGAAYRLIALMLAKPDLYNEQRFDDLLRHLKASAFPLAPLIAAQLQFRMSNDELASAGTCSTAGKLRSEGYSIGTLMVAVCLEYGIAGERDEAASLAAYRAAAESGYGIAHAKVGDMLVRGAGGPPNHASALESYERALKLGYKPAEQRIEALKKARND